MALFCRLRLCTRCARYNVDAHSQSYVNNLHLLRLYQAELLDPPAPAATRVAGAQWRRAFPLFSRRKNPHRKCTRRRRRHPQHSPLPHSTLQQRRRSCRPLERSHLLLPTRRYRKHRGGSTRARWRGRGGKTIHPGPPAAAVAAAGAAADVCVVRGEVRGGDTLLYTLLALTASCFFILSGGSL